jgi:hypothetical protein
MPCFVNGVPLGSALQHFHFDDVTVATSAETIDITWVATKHVVMEQFIAHWAAVPLNSEVIELKKLSGIDSKLDTVLRSVDPSTSGESLTDLACVIPFYWLPGDTVKITYANTDDQNVGAEIFLVEVK